jgi:hypothetical protein
MLSDNNKMKTKKIIDTWKKSNETLLDSSQNQLINPELMLKISGGGASAGNICSLSAECNSSGNSCSRGWTLFSEAARGLWYAMQD